MKKLVIFVSVIGVCICVSFLFSDGNSEGSRIRNLLSIENGMSENELSEKIKSSELRNRPDVILESYMNAYPDTIVAVKEIDGEWALELNDGAIFYWANGRFLTEEKKAHWEDYRSYQVYAYTGKPRDPSGYTDEDIEILRGRTRQDVRGVPQLPQDIDFLSALLGIGDRAETEENIVKGILFGKSVNVNKEVEKTFDSINAEVEALSRTDTEVKEFLDTLSEVSGFSWRVVAGTNRLSNHSYGLAIDMLPRGWGNKMMYWAWVRDYNDDWMLVPQEDLWSPPQKVIKIMENHGFIWGGTWPIYDTMHFEYRPELIEINKRVIFE